MDDGNFTSGSFCKNEILAEIVFHSHSFEAHSVVLLCSRLLARHRLNEVYNNYEVLDQKSLNEIDTNEHQVEDCTACDYKDKLENKQLTNNEKHCVVDINEPGMDCPKQTVSSTEDICSSIQEKFMNLSTNESDEEFKAKWLAYWEENGENCINKKWLEKYQNDSEDQLSMNIIEVYEKHCEEQYNLLYWKYISENYKNEPTTKEHKEANAKWLEYWANNGQEFVDEKWIEKYGNCYEEEHLVYGKELYETHCKEQYYALFWKYINEMDNDTNKVNGGNNENDKSDETVSNSSVHLNDLNNISNFEFIYKYKHFNHVYTSLIRAYQTLSLIGYNYDDQQMFQSAFVRYLKTNLIKSTRHLNIYRFPKMNNSKKCEIEDTPSNSVMDFETDSENTIICNDNKQDELSFLNNLSKDNSEASVGINKEKSKKLLQKEKFEQERAERFDKELERTGYSYLKNNSKLLKYWKKRYFLFSQFDKGIRLDKESWYSVTPEIISAYIAERCSCYVLVDAFCGAGGNAIQFAKTCQLVIAIDIDPKKIEMARHNAELYGVADRIQFIVGDYFLLAPTLKADVVFLSPPWGGPDLMNLENYRLSDIMAKNGGGEYLLHLTRKITSNIALHLPKNINIFDCLKSVENGYAEVQQNVLNSRYNSITVYYNELYGLSVESTVEYLL